MTRLRRGEEVLRSRESSAGLSLLQARGDDGHLVDLLGVAAAGEVVDGGVQTLENGAVRGKATQPLGNLIL